MSILILNKFNINKSNKDFNSKYINNLDKKYFLENFKTIEIFKSKFNEVAVIQKNEKERWPSGLRRTLGKCVSHGTWVQSSLRHIFCYITFIS